MAATMVKLSMGMTMAITILLLNSTTSNAAVNETASKWCDGGLENCLVGNLNFDMEFPMETESSQMLMGFTVFQIGNTTDPDKPAVGDCNLPPRYDSCLGMENIIPNPENCDTYNRGNPCMK